MTNADLMRIYDHAIKQGGSADFTFLYAAQTIIQKTRIEAADIARNRQFALNWNDREAIEKTILELPNSLNGIDFRKIIRS
jgi:hypothetical protein